MLIYYTYQKNAVVLHKDPDKLCNTFILVKHVNTVYIALPLE